MKIEKELLLPEEDTSATFNIKSKMSAGDLAFWGPGVTDEMCRKYSIYSLVDYSAVHGDFRCRYFSTKDYPIFFCSWKKVRYICRLRREIIGLGFMGECVIIICSVLSN